MSSEMNITAAIGMSSGDPSHQQILEQTWSSVGHLVNASSKRANFSCAPDVFSDVIISEGSVEPRQQRCRCPPLMFIKRVGPCAVIVLKTSDELGLCIRRLSDSCSPLFFS